VTRLRDQLRRQPAAAWILYGGTFVNRFGSFVMPMLAIFLTRRGYSAPQAGFAIGCYGFGLVIASAAGGHLADRIGRRNTIVLSMFSSAAAMLALSQARSYSSVVILAVFAGATTEMYRPASHALIGDIVPPEDRVIGFARRPVIEIGYLLNGIGFGLTGLAHTVPALAATVVVWTTAEMLYSPMGGAHMTQLAPERYRGRYMGLLVTTWSLGMIAGPTLGTILFERHEAVLWSSCAVLGVASAALVMSRCDVFHNDRC
jgi:MFS family permease